MQPEAFDQRLRELRDRKPFQPFILELVSGGKLLVGKREAIMYPQRGRSVYFGHDEDLQFVNCENVVRIVELVPAQSA